jgi:hypothetical protein
MRNNEKKKEAKRAHPTSAYWYWVVVTITLFNYVEQQEMSRCGVENMLLMSKDGHVALKSASPQVFFVAPQRKLRFSKVQLRSLCFKLLDATFNSNFYD